MNDMLKSHQFQTSLKRMAEETGKPEAGVFAEAEADLKEMAAQHGKLTVAAWDKFCRWLPRAYSLDADDHALDQLKELNKTSSLVFLPNHRYYLDPLVLRSALQRHGFPPNHVLGGVNLALWPLADIGRHNGIVFIRREFRDDQVYRAVLKSYLAYLIEKRQNLEWYIEGSRTRTGKLRPPKYGILSYLIDAYSAHLDNDVHIIPTSIVYDQQHEVGAISAEESGANKSPESLKWLYEFARSQSRRLGKAHIRFGEPLSLREAVSLTEDENGELRPRLAVPKMAFENANRINEVTPITPVALVTMALLDNEDRAIMVGEGRQILAPILRYIALRELPTTSNVDMSRRGGLCQAIDRLASEGVVTMYNEGEEPVLYVDRDHQHEAAFHKNTIIQFFVTRAIVELAVLHTIEDGEEDLATGVWNHARRLKDLLKFEFFFPNTRDFAKEVAEDSTLAFPDWQEADLNADMVKELFDVTDLHFAHRVLAPFLEAYVILFERLAGRSPAVDVEEESLVEECMQIAQQRWLQHLLHSPESISKDLFRNAIKPADNLGLLAPGGTELQQGRADVATELRADVERVYYVRRLARERAREYLKTATLYGQEH